MTKVENSLATAMKELNIDLPMTNKSQSLNSLVNKSLKGKGADELIGNIKPLDGEMEFEQQGRDEAHDDTSFHVFPINFGPQEPNDGEKSSARGDQNDLLSDEDLDKDQGEGDRKSNFSSVPQSNPEDVKDRNSFVPSLSPPEPGHDRYHKA